MSAETPKSNQTAKIVIIAVGLLLLGGMSFFAVKYFQEKGKNELAEINIGDLTTEIEDIEFDLDNYRTELEESNLDLEEKEELLAEKEQELIEKQKKIDQLLRTNKITKEEAQKLRGKIEQLEFYLKRYQTTIEEQKLEIAALQADKASLTSKVDTIQKKMSKIEMDKIRAETTLKASAYLNAYGFKFYRIKNSGKEVQDTEFRKGKIEQLKICFTVMEEPAAKAGPRDFYIQILDGSNKVIRDAGTQSGYFKMYDEEKPYSLMKTVNYDRVTTEYCLTFTQPENYDYDRGMHKVVVFDAKDNNQIGKGQFEVK